ncbi:type VII secretion protein EccB, Actinobacterial [Frankia torreyi]|uniref:Type VII secretion protein EccB, Actinobacterial n=1 Tax=Frankia torreyi TaxID=1856 RepID=A0A0D8B6C9_9ACTN|nr:type VII secretion protein EccB [Frankia torreyi]KJE19675.1 type VII secretion protein EccB, Actinobacterial [Frankia torreyi]
MRSRRDQVNAHNYMVFRLTGALVRAEPDILESPTRRDLRGLVTGGVAAILLLAVVAIWALISARGSTAWRKPGALIMEKSSGSRFLLVDGALRPVRNIASARLLTGQAVTPVVVPRSRLAGVPRGAPLGLANAPDTLPDPSHLNDGVWRLCAGPGTGGGPAGETAAVAAPSMVLDVGVAAAKPRIGADVGLLVSSDGQEHLLWRGQRLLLARPWAADVLGFGAIIPTAVPRTWLDLVPPGPDLAPVAVPDAGTPGPPIGGQATRRGELFAVTTATGSVAHYILLASGLTALSPTQFALARGEAGDAPEHQLTPGDLATAARVAMTAPQNTLPPTPPQIRLLSPRESVCVESSPDPAGSAFDVVVTTVHAAAGRRTSGATAIGVTAGGGALVVPRLLPRDSSATEVARQPGVLVDGSGMAYPATGDAIKALGYAPEQAVAAPWKLVALLPTGPSLTTPGRGG